MNSCCKKEETNQTTTTNSTRCLPTGNLCSFWNTILCIACLVCPSDTVSPDMAHRAAHEQKTEPSWDLVTSSHTGRRNLTVPGTSWQEEATKSSQEGTQGRDASLDSPSLILLQPPGPAGPNIPTAIPIRMGDTGRVGLATHPPGSRGSENTLRFTCTRSLPNRFSSSLIVSDLY